MPDDRKNREAYPRSFSDVFRRTFSPFKSVKFRFYFLFGVVLFGGLGIWIELFTHIFFGMDNREGILTALTAFYPAIICAACIQILLEATKKANDHLTMFSFSAFTVTIIIAIVLSIIGSDLLDKKPFESIAIYFSALISMLGTLVWCTANHANKIIQDPNPDSTVGGIVKERKLEGNLDGVKHD